MPEEVDARQLAERIRAAADEAENETALKIRVESILHELVFTSLGIPWSSYEYTLVSGERIDSLFGSVVIEYESPGTLGTASGFQHAVEQVKGYITTASKEAEAKSRYFGVVLDGRQIGFVRLRRTWEVQGPVEVNRYSVLKFLEALRGLKRKPLRADLLNREFGPGSPLAREAVTTLYRRLLEAKHPRVSVLFEDWKRVFSEVCGYGPEKLKGIERNYRLTPEKVEHYDALFFAASEVAVLVGDSYLQSYVKTLEGAYLRSRTRFKEELQKLEDGGIFADIGIKNFLEGDYFSWYLDDWDESLVEVIIRIVSALSNFEPGTVELEPEAVRDLLKKLYQFLVPEPVRRQLGEFYTPDWLAELVLETTGWDGNPSRRVLDPACGSGTFLVIAIRKAKEYADEHFLDRKELLDFIVRNIVGYDLNPLAVIASRVNYLLGLGELLRYRSGILELPVYLADSILVERRPTYSGEQDYVISTVAGDFVIPTRVVDQGLLPRLLGLIDEGVELNYDRSQFRARLERELPEAEEVGDRLWELFQHFVKLHGEDRNRIWTKIIRNSVAPLLQPRFDYVVGNPPWVGWEVLPKTYREKSKPLWVNYGLINGRGRGKGAIGKAKKELAMLFVAVSAERYLKESGRLALLIPYTGLKSPAGAGFRRFLAQRLKVDLIHDLVELAPFEQATNRTSLLVARRGTTDFPVRCVIWTRAQNGRIHPEMSLQEVLLRTSQEETLLTPIKGVSSPETSWQVLVPETQEVITKVLGSSVYDAASGVVTGLNGVYIVEVVSAAGGRCVVRNLPSEGRTVLDHHVGPIEPQLLYPLLRGRDVKKWSAIPNLYIVVPCDSTGDSFSIAKMKVDFPEAFKFLHHFMEPLIQRNAEPWRTRFASFRGRKFKLDSMNPPFYWLFNVRPSLAPYKVVWKDTAGKITGKAEFSVAVVGPTKTEFGETKVPVPVHTVMFIPFDNETEAHYVAAVLNSSPVRLAVAGYVIERHIATHVPKHVRIPRYETSSEIHRALAELSKRAHEARQRSDLTALRHIETEIDRTVARLYGIDEADLEAVARALAVFGMS